MRGLLTVLSPEAYAAWAAEASANCAARASTPPTRPPTGAGTGSDEIESNERRPATGRGHADSLQPIHPPPTSFVRRYLFSTDHKVIAKQFLWAGLLFLLFGGPAGDGHPLAVGLPGPAGAAGRASCCFRGSGGVISPAAYNAIFTMHGLVMIFFAITPLLIGAFGNLTIPLMIGARDMAFPRLNMLSFWTFVLSLVLVTASFFVQLGSAAAGWTTYPPLATKVGTPGRGPDAGGGGAVRHRRGHGHGRAQLRHHGHPLPGAGHGLHADAADGLGAVAHLDPEHPVRAGAGRRPRCCCSSTACSAPSSSSPARPRCAAAATPSCSSTCSGSSATRRSTS